MAEQLRFRPEDTSSLPPVEDEKCYGMGEVLVANSAEGLGLMLDEFTNSIMAMRPEGNGAQGGLLVGDVILAVDDQVVTTVDWRPSDQEGVVVCRAPVALAPAGSALDPTRPAVSLRVLRPVPGEPPLEAAEPPPPSQPGVEPQHVPTYEATPPLSAAMPSPAHAGNPLDIYPWATEIETADGAVKTKYNVPRGTTLAPLEPLQRLDADATMRKTAAFAAPLGRDNFSGAPPRRR